MTFVQKGWKNKHQNGKVEEHSYRQRVKLIEYLGLEELIHSY